MKYCRKLCFPTYPIFFIVPLKLAPIPNYIYLCIDVYTIFIYNIYILMRDFQIELLTFYDIV